MEGINRATLLGNLGADPELRFTQSGTAVMGLRLATATRFKDKDGEWKERTEWHSVVVWGARAEALSKLLHKGESIYIEGEIRNSSYEDKDGNKRFKSEVHAHTVILPGGRQGADRPSDDRQNDRRPEQRRDDDRGRDRARADERDNRRDDRRGGRGDERRQAPAEDDFPASWG